MVLSTLVSPDASTYNKYMVYIGITSYNKTIFTYFLGTGMSHPLSFATLISERILKLVLNIQTHLNFLLLKQIELLKVSLSIGTLFGGMGLFLWWVLS